MGEVAYVDGGLDVTLPACLIVGMCVCVCLGSSGQGTDGYMVLSKGSNWP